jgi:hypothetical protein
MVVQDYSTTCGPNGPKMSFEVMFTGGGNASDLRLADRVLTVLWDLYDKYEGMLARLQATNDALDHSRVQGQARPRGGVTRLPRVVRARIALPANKICSLLILMTLISMIK